MVVEASHRPLRPSTQEPLEDCYGFPPPPSTLRQTAMAISTKPLPQMLASPSPSPSTVSPSPTPPAHYLMHHAKSVEPQIIEYSSNLTDYLVKNPGMKRLYNNHGSIKRPACVSCNESRKKCDLERPCTRCVKQKLSCIERPPRAKKRKIEHEFPITPLPHYPPALNIIQYGLPSPSSEPQSEVIVGTPMELDIEPMPKVHCVDGRPLDEGPSRASYNTSATPDCSEIEACGERAICNSDADTHNHHDVANIESVLEVPLPMGSYLDGISSTLSGVPVFGLEGSDSTLNDILLKELERDLGLGDENLDASGTSSLLWFTDGMAKGNKGVKPALQAMDVGVLGEEMRIDLRDVDALMEYLPTDQEIKEILGWGLEMTDVQIDGMGDLSAYADAPGADFSTAAEAFGWSDDWSV